jgi:hypothetical protein
VVIILVQFKAEATWKVVLSLFLIVRHKVYRPNDRSSRLVTFECYMLSSGYELFGLAYILLRPRPKRYPALGLKTPETLRCAYRITKFRACSMADCIFSGFAIA